MEEKCRRNSARQSNKKLEMCSGTSRRWPVSAILPSTMPRKPTLKSWQTAGPVVLSEVRVTSVERCYYIFLEACVIFILMAELYPFIKKQDNEVYKALQGEEKRQAEGIELIPSENYVSKAVREANASNLTNKYSEGYPGKR